MESHKLAVRAEKLEAFLRFLSSARAEIRYSSMPVESILLTHGEGISFFSYLHGVTADGAWSDAWNDAVTKHAKDEGFFPKDLELLKGFGAGFGSSDTEGQLAHFSLYENLAASALDEAKKERDRKSKLYLMLGIFGGTAAAILLC
jgi:stage III sporulation protein AB